ncbi:MAG TPA: hypothetical protein VMV10_16475, partial [Pirellulales bacterium]|nr:hypothetical protein [Pirellulales bacterium]
MQHSLPSRAIAQLYRFDLDLAGKHNGVPFDLNQLRFVEMPLEDKTGAKARHARHQPQQRLQRELGACHGSHSSMGGQISASGQAALRGRNKTHIRYSVARYLRRDSLGWTMETKNERSLPWRGSCYLRGFGN